MDLHNVADTFSFSFNAAESGKYCRILNSSDGEEYIVSIQRSKHYFNDCTGRHGVNCIFTIKWKRMSNKFMRLRYYKEIGNEILSDRKLFVKHHELSAVFAFDIPIKTTVVVVINIIPYASVPKCKDDILPLCEKQNPKSTNKEPVVEKKLEELSTDMRILLQTGNLSDIILTDGETEIQAHNVVLSARSSVFAKMLQHPMQENRENRIIIKDISIEVLRGLLDFMYAGTAIIKDMEMARDLYVAADKYDVQSLKTVCTKMLISVDLDNVIDTLLLADLYGDMILKQPALKFIANNYSQLKILQSWDTFMKENQTLAIEILSYVLERNIL